MNMYIAAADRYESMHYNRCGGAACSCRPCRSGLWHNFGGVDDYENGRAIVRRAFDRGVTHFDLANNYGPPPGSAEENFGRHAAGRSAALPRRADHLDQGRLLDVARARTASGARGSICSRASIRVSSGWGSSTSTSSTPTAPIPTRRSKRRWAPSTRRCGRARRCTSASRTTRPSKRTQACEILDRLGIHCLIHQPKYSMFERWVEGGLLDVLGERGVGCIPFSPLAQGLLTDRYLTASRTTRAPPSRTVS